MAAQNENWVLKYLWSTDHKIIAMQYLFTGMAMALIGGYMAYAFRMQLAFPGADVPGYGISWLLIGSIALVSSGIFLVVMMLLVKAQRRVVVTGPEEMIGSEGQVIDWSGDSGRIHVHGEDWRARATKPLEPGQRVRVADIDGLTLVVKPTAKRRRSES